jgi:hypothetical protein
MKVIFSNGQGGLLEFLQKIQGGLLGGQQMATHWDEAVISG